MRRYLTALLTSDNCLAALPSFSKTPCASNVPDAVVAPFRIRSEPSAINAPLGHWTYDIEQDLLGKRLEIAHTLTRHGGRRAIPLCRTGQLGTMQPAISPRHFPQTLPGTRLHGKFHSTANAKVPGLKSAPAGRAHEIDNRHVDQARCGDLHTQGYHTAAVCANYASAGREDDKEEPVPRSAHRRAIHGRIQQNRASGRGAAYGALTSTRFGQHDRTARSSPIDLRHIIYLISRSTLPVWPTVV